MGQPRTTSSGSRGRRLRWLGRAGSGSGSGDEAWRTHHTWGTGQEAAWGLILLLPLLLQHPLCPAWAGCEDLGCTEGDTHGLGGGGEGPLLHPIPHS